MRIAAINADDLYQRFRIETDRSGKFWVADKGGPNVVCSERFDTKAEAQREWSRRVEAAYEGGGG